MNKNMAQIISCIGTKLGHNIQNISIMPNRNIKQMRDLYNHLFGHTVVSPQQLKGQNIEYQCFVPFFVSYTGRKRDRKNKSYGT